jgi:hypothetical protein
MALVMAPDGGKWRVAALHNMDLPKPPKVEEVRKELTAAPA